ncbi:cytochrome P450 82C4-like [Chenopodium quinoa]|uniref:cytochrome P450 82C4-like n=1 Tax=Chenopodium quinoa TaxID=63459 RepID=UPI000B76BB2C|nr:cytochrome P450 82C4-like [Chenopodium quinoa]
MERKQTRGEIIKSLTFQLFDSTISIKLVCLRRLITIDSKGNRAILIRWKNRNQLLLQQVSLIGHLHLLGELPHITLGKLADKYGQIFMIKLGIHRALVVSTAEMAKECLGGTNDKVFLNRPQKIFVKHMVYNGMMLGFSKYGQYWREMRKITIVELLSAHRVEMLKNVRISEVRSAMKSISISRSELTDMKQWFTNISMNTIVRLVSGKSLKEFYQGEEYHRCAKAFRDFFELAGVFVPADALPLLRWFDIGGYERKMKKAGKEIDQIAQRWLDEHKNRNSKEAQGKLDFMDVMLGIFESGQEKPSKYETDTIIKATCMVRNFIYALNLVSIL